MTLQYRATLNDPLNTAQERPVTILGSNLEEIRKWAAKILPGALEGASVVVYQTVETQLEVIPKESVQSK